ncbi:hypothetical protein GCM10011529_08660 [Polymorphobacter glacialis]|uniref:NTP pyrophosphohydrolase MazG-like domain-containing protein n=1 Tax=Sandarakinorhabdus glacialis TaxID=1614636 RepID=A0A917E4V1_9SPHN|nr:hypothetical protein GCM10011529_08660 [Polymorphobacter glacialis]
MSDDIAAVLRQTLSMAPAPTLSRLAAIMARLRDPVDGCPWDRAQSFATIAPYTIEEAYEVAEAIAVGDMGELKGELGDLLLQVVFHSRIAEEAGHFALDDVVAAICDKMERRHPHIFGQGVIVFAFNLFSIEQLHRTGRHNRRDGVLVHELRMAVTAQQHREVIEPGDDALQFDAVDEKHCHRGLGLADRVQENILQVVCFVGHVRTTFRSFIVGLPRDHLVARRRRPHLPGATIEG